MGVTEWGLCPERGPEHYVIKKQLNNCKIKIKAVIIDIIIIIILHEHIFSK